MSSIKEELDERPMKKKEPTDRNTLPCGICEQKIRTRKYQSHWVRCFLGKEKNSAKVKGRNISRHVKLKKEPEIGGEELEINAYM